MNFFKIAPIFVLLLFFVMAGSGLSEGTAEESYGKGELYTVQGKFLKAKKEFEKTLGIKPDHVLAKESLATIDAVIEQKIKWDTALFLFKGYAYINKELFDDGIAEFSKAITGEPDYFVAYIHRGSAYLNKGEHDQAITDFNNALKINPHLATGYSKRGVAYYKKGNFDLALSDYNKSIEIDPDDAFAYTNRGFLYMIKLDKKGKACSDWKRACELSKCSNYDSAKKKGDCK
jgi:tetratricopeptide (TPR) repeat protein